MSLNELRGLQSYYKIRRARFLKNVTDVTKITMFFAGMGTLSCIWMFAVDGRWDFAGWLARTVGFTVLYVALWIAYHEGYGRAESEIKNRLEIPVNEDVGSWRDRRGYEEWHRDWADFEEEATNWTDSAGE